MGARRSPGALHGADSRSKTYVQTILVLCVCVFRVRRVGDDFVLFLHCSLMLFLFRNMKWKHLLMLRLIPRIRENPILL